MLGLIFVKHCKLAAGSRGRIPMFGHVQKTPNKLCQKQNLNALQNMGVLCNLSQNETCLQGHTSKNKNYEASMSR